MREQLLGYLLGALDAHEHAEVERQLKGDPRLCDELESLAASLEPLESCRQEFEPGSGLAERTCDLISEQVWQQRPAPSTNRLTRDRRYEIQSRNQWSFADVIVMAGVSLIAAMLFFPAISHSRYAARLTQCQNNLRELGLALVDFSQKAGRGYFPKVPVDGNQSFAGIYAPLLVDAGYLQDEYLVLCPNVPLDARTDTWRLPTLVELDQASGPVLAELQQIAGGTYGYSLGFVDQGQYQAPPNLGRTYFAIMSDAPLSQFTSYSSENHGGRGQNFLYEDGHVSFVADVRAISLADHPFQNRLGWMEAGMDINDVVIAPSFTPPFSRAVRSVRN